MPANYASGEVPRVGDVVECVAVHASVVSRSPKQAARIIGRQFQVSRVVEHYVGFDVNDYLKRADRFKLIRRAEGSDGE